MREAITRSDQSPQTSIPQAADLIERRIKGISQWLSENFPECTSEQSHLDEGSRERQYWHYGYLVALKDIRKLLGFGGDAIN